MEKTMKEKVRPFYSEFQGYLSQAPQSDNPEQTTYKKSIWEHYNQAVNLLSQVAGQDYARFLANPQTGRSGRPFLPITEYRQKLSGLISRLHGEHFSDETPPFSGMPSQVITTTQQQIQSVQVQMLLEIQSKIDENLSKCEEGSKEKSFLESFMSKLSKITSVTELLSECLKLAKEYGISIATLLSLFS